MITYRVEVLHEGLLDKQLHYEEGSTRDTQINGCADGDRCPSLSHGIFMMEMECTEEKSGDKILVDYLFV